jgi:hypothetical protein
MVRTGRQRASAGPWAVFLLAACLAVGGCGKSVGDVSGKVTYRNQPVGNGTVTILASDRLTYHGAIDPDGSFAIKRVPVGPGKVAITSQDPSTGALKKAGSGANARAQLHERSGVGVRSPIPLKYSDFEKSGLSIAVQKGPNNQADFPLKD